jgi:hypothetical protein
MDPESTEALQMKLISSRRAQRAKLGRISISQAEITADLIYPASSAQARDWSAAASVRRRQAR